MFGIEKLREEVLELRDSLDHFKSQFIDYADNEVKFDEVREILRGLQDDFFEVFEAKFKMLLKDLPAKKKPALKREPKKKHP